MSNNIINTNNNSNNNVIHITNNNVKYYEELAEDYAANAQRSASECANYISTAQRLVNDCENIKETIYTSYASELIEHIQDDDNPHNVSAEQINTYEKDEIDSMFQELVEDLPSIAYDDTEIRGIIANNYYTKNEIDSKESSLQSGINNCVGKTDYASENGAGIVKVGSSKGTAIDSNNICSIYMAQSADIDSKSHQYRPIVPANLDYAVKKSVTSNTNTLTGVEQAAAHQWLGISNRNIGEIVQSTMPLTDAGLHLLDGALILGCGGYTDFVDYIAGLDQTANYFCTEQEWQDSVTQYGVCGKFVYDDVNNTVRLPKITGVVEGTTDITALGNLVEAGLPNITGVWNVIARTTDETKSGCCDWSLGNYNQFGGDSARGTNKMSINASSSNPIYGNSTTVQPQTIKTFYYIVIATAAKTNIEVDIDEIATDLNGKADVDLTNCSNVANIKMAHNAMPSNTYIDLTLGASDSMYTAPADGWYSISKITGSDWYTIYLRVLDDTGNNVLLSQTLCGYRTTELKGSLPIKKGQKFQMWYNATGTTNYFRFIYAKGSESEAQ